ncbi:3-deoxy-D-manno-octulosonic acid transferase [Sulfitobacter donghicola]|uniref:3-deoxy-D-manno-octulosonic acid transferase n=1 Tax=Sulfitobacter donghicola DSW-25 = KCTC 12864 = JCM 14565 TaxID=1300350 RepID=A0A073IHY7_9RHOB|nr:3-deoxy-D-manno-octulosonic acid transferase [Sulfitobacter donghicola]KEJ89399.1 3-deoxy-D-manno-octulosonic acid transferase [Sulfitobacter donghicola DSW-25 = KCTC 12864 = JCM 14565]KIN69215.1 3-deoxy-D-manno-octulosonic acid transferase [Sulfitobacter donghicola DSW-25 = KCTC 12864 = JCM 14565]
MRVPVLYRAYVALSMVLVPFVARATVKKLQRADVPTYRAHERLGNATENRANGTLIWFHAASVGESLSVLALMTRMGEQLPSAHFLITSGTATSAALIEARMPPRCVHQFAPLDAPGPLKRFLRHWQPDAAIFVESELWPQMLRRTYASGATMALVNARMSERSIASWAKRPRLAAYLFDVFDLILTQNDAMAEAMVRLQAPAPKVARGQNLKSFAGPLPQDHDLIFEARATLGHRPVWVAASTHAGEEQGILAAHKRLLEQHPDLLLILVPRHPERGDEVLQLISEAGMSYSRRSSGDLPSGEVFLADTLGELGNWYALSDIVFLGGSLLPIGGHNPFEVAQSGATVLSGTHVFNFAETFSAMEAAGAAGLVAGKEDIPAQVNRLLNDTNARAKAIVAAKTFANGENSKLDTIAARLIKALKLT